jgi:hypothetical protein
MRLDASGRCGADPSSALMQHVRVRARRLALTPPSYSAPPKGSVVPKSTTAIHSARLAIAGTGVERGKVATLNMMSRLR